MLKENTKTQVVMGLRTKTIKEIVREIKTMVKSGYKSEDCKKINISDMDKIFAELSEDEITRNHQKDGFLEYSRSLYQISKDGRFHRPIFTNASILIFGAYVNSYGLRIYDEVSMTLQLEEPRLMYRTCRILNKINIEGIILLETKDSYYILSKEKADPFEPLDAPNE